MPPYRNISVTYEIQSVTLNDIGVYECELGMGIDKTYIFLKLAGNKI